MRNTKRKALILATATMGLLQTNRGSGATFTWSGGDGSNSLLSFAGNWQGNIAPVAGDFLQFTGSTNTSPSNNYAAGTSFSGILFDSGASGFSIGGNSLALGTAASASLGVTNSSSNPQTISAPINLVTGQSYITTSSGAGNLTLGAITRATGSTAAFNISGGAIKTSVANDATGIIGGWATIVMPGSSVGAFATNDGSGNITTFTYSAANTFDSTQTVTGTTATANVQETGGGNIAIGAGATSTTAMNTLLFDEQNTAARTVTIAGTLAFNAGGGMFHAYESGTTNSGTYTIAGGTITTTGTGELFVRTRLSPDPSPSVGAPEGTTINSLIADPTGGKLTLVKSGYGVLRLGATNTYSGGTYVDEGQLRVTAGGGMGTGSVVVASGAFVLLNNASAFSNPFFISGIGPTEAEGASGQFNDGAIRFITNGASISGKVTLLADSDIGARSAASAGNAANGGTLSGQITGNFNLGFNEFTQSGTSSVAGTMATVTLTNTTNNWTGDTTLGEGRLRIGANEVIPDGPGFGNVILNGDIVPSTSASTGYTVLSLDGHTETINGLNSSGLLSEVFVTNSGFGTLAGSTGTLIIGNNNASGAFGGSIQDDTAIVAITKIGTGTETFSGQNTYRGTTTINAGVLALASGGSLQSGVISVGAAGKLDLTAAGGYTLGNINGDSAKPQTLSGLGHVVGAVTTASGGTVAPGAVGGAGTLTFDNDLNLNGGRLSLDLNSAGTTLGGGVNDLLVVSGSLFPQSQTNIFINRFNGPLPSNSTYTIAQFGSLNSANGGSTNLILPVVRQGLSLIQNANNLQIHLGSGAPASLSWRGDNSGNNWDANQTIAWRNGGSGAANDVFFDWDSVTFDNNGLSNPTVNIGGTVSPDNLTVSNTSGSYTFSGGGKISGLAGIIKNGAGALIVNTTGGNDFAGPITINAGTLQIGDGNTGNVTIPTTSITNNGVLNISRQEDATFANVINGSGVVVKAGNGTLTLSASNSYTGTTTITSGILKAGNAAALGSATGGTTISPGAALDVAGLNLGAEIVTLQGGGQGPNGNGLIVNSGADQTQALQKVELIGGAATFGGSAPFAGRVDLRGPTGVGGFFHGNGNDINKVGSANIFSFVGLMETGIGSIDIQAGTLQFERSTLGDPTKAATIEGGAVLQLFGNFPNMTKPIISNGGTLLSTSNGTEAVINAPITFNGSTNFVPSNVKMTVNGNISGNGGLDLYLNGGTLSTLVLNGSNSYSGDTNVHGGTLIVNGTIASGNINTPSGTVNFIGGVGVIAHDVNGNSSTTFLPGGSLAVGTLTVGGTVNAGGGGSINFDLGSTATVGGGVNDFLSVGQSLNLNSVTNVVINPIAGTLAGNSTYVLARANSIDSNAGANNVSITFLGGALTDTRITSLAVTTSAHPNEMDLVVTGAPANINWNGGASTVWDLHTTANFAGGPADNQFFNLDTVNFTAGSSAVTVTGTLRPGAVNVNSAQSYTFSGGTLTGGMSLTKSGSGQLTINETNTYTGQTIVNGGILQIGSTNALGTAGSIVIANAAGAVLNLGTVSQTTTGLTGGGANGGEVKVGGSGNFTVNIASTLSNTYSGILSGTGTLTKAGLGSLTLNGSVPFTGGVTVSGGTLSMGANLASIGTLNIGDSALLRMTSGPKTVGVTTLNLNTTGVLDLNDSLMVLDYTGASPLATIANQIKAGATDQSSSGPGNIISSAAIANNAISIHKTAIGYADASTLGVTSFAGKNVDTTAVLARYTYLGDANLDGKVNALDFNAVASNFGGTGKTWAQGDFNFDGSVNTTDFTSLSQNFDLVFSSPALSPSLGSLVPEPSLVGLAAFGAIAMSNRRRKRRN